MVRAGKNHALDCGETGRFRERIPADLGEIKRRGAPESAEKLSLFAINSATAEPHILDCAGRAPRRQRFENRRLWNFTFCESGVALRLPPQSKNVSRLYLRQKWSSYLRSEERRVGK